MINRSQLSIKCTALFTCIGWTIPNADAANVLIDSFDVTPQSVAKTGKGAATPSTTAASEAIGGSRKIELTVNTGTDTATIDVNHSNSGMAAYSEATGVEAAATITWDANGAGLGGGAGVDLTDAGTNDSIVTRIVLSNQYYTTIAIALTDDSGNSVVAPQITWLVPPSGEKLSIWSFKMLQIKNPSLDLTAITSIKLEIDLKEGSNTDLIFDFIDARDCFQTETEKITASDAATEDCFGDSVAISGNTAVVGARYNDDAGDRSGSAYVFKRDGGGNWNEITKLAASDATSRDFFGRSVAIDGDWAIVGANGKKLAGDSVGAAYVFERNHGGAENWGEVKKLTASDPTDLASFGNAVSIKGDLAIVGAFRSLHAGEHTGAAYIFARNHGGNDNWGEVKKLIASDAANADRFGGSVGIDGDTIVVGAESDDNGTIDCGSAYIFARNHGGKNNWGEVKKLTASDAAEDDYFGESVAIHGDTALIGAWLNGNDGESSGSAYIFARHQGGIDNWGEVKKITASDNGGYFGGSVALHGDTALIGAGANGTNGKQSGSAYLFARNHGGSDYWGVVKKLSASDAADGDYFGISTALRDDFAIVGALYNDDACPSDIDCNSGSAYVFGLFPDCNNNGIDDADDITGGVSCDRNANLIPDECEAYCIADLNCDTLVKVQDLVILINAWGSIGPADLNTDGIVNVNDLLMLIGAWGPCT